jgi:hypothetical protein
MLGATTACVALEGLHAGSLNAATAPKRRPKPMARRFMYHVTSPENVMYLKNAADNLIWPRDIFQTGMGSRTVEEVQEIINALRENFPRCEVAVNTGVSRMDEVRLLDNYHIALFDYEKSSLPEDIPWIINDFDYCFDQVETFVAPLWDDPWVGIVPTASPLHQVDLGWDYGELAIGTRAFCYTIPMTQGLAARGTLSSAIVRLRDQLAARQYPTLQGGIYLKPTSDVASIVENTITPAIAATYAREAWSAGLGIVALWGTDCASYVSVLEKCRNPR